MLTAAELDAVSKKTLGAAFRVHSILGPGMLETAYRACLVHELRLSGLEVRVEVPVPLVYKGIKMADVGYRMDLLVEGELIIEIKSLERIAPVHVAQLVSYLKLADKRLGILFNFNVASLSEGGIFRRVHNF